MIRRSIFFLLCLFLLCCNCPSQELYAAENKTDNHDSVESIEKNNELMLVFVERLKSGNIKEARKIAQDMAAFSEKYKDNASTEYKSFYSEVEKEIYLQSNKNDGKKVIWVDEPIADGYYFLAVLDFQERQYKDAINNIQKCIFWNPVHAAYYSERGFIFLNSGIHRDLISAQVAYEKTLELADNSEDFASGLRGLGFVFAEKDEFETAVAALVLSKEFVADNADAEEQIVRIKQFIPNYDFNMNAKKAVSILKANKIQTTFSTNLTKALLNLASKVKLPEEKNKAIAYLLHARELEPQNVEVLNKLKALQK